MPEPTTAAVLGSLLIASAVKQIGTRAGDAIADGIFGKSNDHQEIKNSLYALHQKVDEILQYSRSTYSLVERLPEVVQGIVDQQTLYLAHNELESNFQTYIKLPQWHGTIGHDTLARVLAAWNIVVDKESSLERLLDIPRYGEFMLLVTHGQLYESVISGTQSKLNAVSSALETLTESQLLPAALEAERMFGTQHVKVGKLLEGSPWIAWTVESSRTRTETTCIERLCRECNGGIASCYDKQVPDIAWNSQLVRTSELLETLRRTIESLSAQLHSYVVVQQLLLRYIASLKARSAAVAAQPHVNVVEALEAFPVGAAA